MRFLRRLLASLDYRAERLATRFVSQRELHRILSQLPQNVGDDFSLDEARMALLLTNYGSRFHTLIDVGSHKGRFASSMHKVFSFREIVCVEPDRALHPDLTRHLPAHALVVSEAISREGGVAQFHIHPDRSMNSLQSVGEDFRELNQWYEEREIQTVSVPTRTLDSLLQLTESSDTADILLKLDVQGHEHSVLQSGSRLLGRTSVVVLECMFWHGYSGRTDFRVLLECLYDSGFEMREVASLVYRGRRTAYIDAVFVRRTEGERNEQ